jgi:hypothetical protein
MEWNVTCSDFPDSHLQDHRHPTKSLSQRIIMSGTIRSAQPLSLPNAFGYPLIFHFPGICVHLNSSHSTIARPNVISEQPELLTLI